MTLHRVGRGPMLVVEESGRGRPLLLLHGVGGHRRNWARELATWSSRYRVLAWDARGYGDSDAIVPPFEIDAFAEDVRRVLDTLGIERLTLVGLSLGATVALEVAARWPTRLDALILVSAIPALHSSLPPAEREAFLAARQAPLLAGRTPAEIAPAVARGLAGPNATPDVLATIEDSIARLHAPSYLEVLAASVRYEPRLLTVLDLPALALYGGADRLCPPAVREELRRYLPAAELAVVPDAGHLLNLEAPEAFDAAVLGFLSRRLA